MTAEELLLALKDIQAPPQPDWWQIAPIWWVLLLTFLAIGLCYYWLKRRRKSNRLVYLARQELAGITAQSSDSKLVVLKLSEWLKQVSLLAFPERQLQSLTGIPWLNFLDECLGGNDFCKGPGKIFGAAIYSQNIDLETSQIVVLCEQWLSAVKPRLQQRGRS